MGGETYVHTEVFGQNVLVKINGDMDPPETGDQLHLTLDSNKLHLFDPKSEKRIAGEGIA